MFNAPGGDATAFLISVSRNLSRGRCGFLIDRAPVLSIVLDQFHSQMARHGNRFL